MSRRIVVTLCLVALLASVGIPTISGLSPWRLSAGRTRHAEESAARLGTARVEDRDRAERELVDLGPAALPVLGDLPADLPAEILLRARRAAASIRRKGVVG